MDPGPALREARCHSALTQAELAARSGTSQANVSSYENGRKQPSVATLSRLLAAAGWRLTVVRARRPVREPSARQLARTAGTLAEVLALAEELPVRHEPELRFPPLATLQRPA